MQICSGSVDGQLMLVLELGTMSLEDKWRANEKLWNGNENGTAIDRTLRDILLALDQLHTGLYFIVYFFSSFSSLTNAFKS